MLYAPDIMLSGLRGRVYPSRGDFEADRLRGSEATFDVIATAGVRKVRLHYVVDPLGTAIADSAGVTASPLNTITPLHWGAPFGGAGNAQPAAQAAVDWIIARGNQATLLFPQGVYRLVGPLVVTGPVHLRGEAEGVSVLHQANAADTVVRIQPVDPGGAAKIGQCTVAHLSLGWAAADTPTGGWGLELIGADNIDVRHVRLTNVANGIRLAGGQLVDLLGVFALGKAGSPVAGSALLRIEPRPLSAGGAETPFTINAVGLNLSGNNGVTDVIDVRGVDGFDILGGKLNKAARSLLAIQPGDAATGYVAAVHAIGVYGDGTNSTPYGVYMPNTGTTGTIGLRVAANTWGNFTNSAVFCRNTRARNLRFDTSFVNNGQWHVDIEGSSDTTSGTRVSLPAEAVNAPNGYRVVNAQSVEIQGGPIQNTPGTAIFLDGTIERVRIDAILDANGVNIDNQSINEWVETIGSLGNVDLGGPRGTFTPTLRAGAAASDATVASATGLYVRAGGVAELTATLHLTSTGTVAGAVALRLPATDARGRATPVPVAPANVSVTMPLNSALGTVQPVAQMAAGSRDITLWRRANGALTPLTIADLAAPVPGVITVHARYFT